jgi:DNA-directed RNA polymerase subunit M/transcription elongation factor TFIIS
MDIEEQFSIEAVLFRDRKCRTCGETKDLVDGFYLTRKNRGNVPSSYSYECKECTIKRVKSRRKSKEPDWAYPDW